MATSSRPPNSQDLECLDFVDSIGRDFYVKLPNYTNHCNRPFNTQDLSMTELISIAECYVIENQIKDMKATGIKVPLDVTRIIDVVVNRIDRAPVYGYKARAILKGLQCFKATDSDRRRGRIVNLEGAVGDEEIGYEVEDEVGSQLKTYYNRSTYA